VMRLKWKLNSVRLVIVVILMQDRSMVWPNIPLAQKSFSTHPMVFLSDRLECMLDSVHLEIMLNLMQDRCTVRTERTTGSEIIFDAPDGSPK
jgi:hypothetical protein